MDHYEMVEKLRAKANVSYEEAKAALEASDWDMLDALVLLESEGKVKDAEKAPEFTTQEKKTEKAPVNENNMKDGMHRLWELIKKLFQKGNANQFVITRNGQEMLSMPITVLVLLVLVLWPASMLVLFIALFFGARYSFRGPDVSGKAGGHIDLNATIDRVQDKVAQAVDTDRDGENKAE